MTHASIYLVCSVCLCLSVFHPHVLTPNYIIICLMFSVQIFHLIVNVVLIIIIIIMCDTGTDNLGRWQLARITGPVVFFSIILPLIDNVTDLILIVKLYFGVNYCDHYCFSPSTYGSKTCAGYYQCRENATTYCNNLDENSNDESCQFRRYTTLASSLLCK